MKVSIGFLECNTSLPRKCLEVLFKSGQVGTGQFRKGQVGAGQVRTGKVETGRVGTGQVRT